MTTYRLGSSPLVSAPGLVAWAKNGYSFPKDRKTMVRIISECWHIPAEAAKALLSGKAKHTIEDETVVFTA
jgi:hypothetical protein